MPTPYFNIPFATAGDKAVIPDASGPSGDVAFDTGYGPNYEGTQPGPPALDIERQEFNQLQFQLTTFAKDAFEQGILEYDVVVDYIVGGLTRGSDDLIYQAALDNGPSNLPATDPVGDTTGRWFNLAADIWIYSATTDYKIGQSVKGSDFRQYVCVAANGPTAGVVDPTTNSSQSHWVILKTELWEYSTGHIYRIGSYVKGSDNLQYRALIANGPTISIVNPVGDITGTWEYMTGHKEATKVTVFTASDPVWVPDPKTKSLTIYATGGGGGGGGAEGGGASQVGLGTGGGGGGTAIKTTSAIDASYAIVIASGGTGGLGATPAAGTAGGSSTVTSSGGSISPVIGNGGGGGLTGGAASVQFDVLGAVGGTVSGGDIINQEGQASSHAVASEDSSGDAQVAMYSSAGGSYWGGAPRTPAPGVDGLDGVSFGSGGTGAAAVHTGSDFDGGDGQDGVVQIVEHF